MTISQSIKAKAIRTFIFIIRMTPLWVLNGVSYLVSHLLSKALRREMRIAYAQLAFALPEVDAKRTFRGSLHSVLMTSFEGFRTRELLDYPTINSDIATIENKSGRVEIYGLEILKLIVENKQSAVCLTGHLGNFELMAAYFSTQGFPMAVIARKANDPVYQDILSDIRTGYGLNMLWREDPETAKYLMKAIRNNSFICAMLDQDVDLENAFTPFFGLDAAHPVSPVKIAVRFKKPVVFLSTYRDAQLQHHVRIERIHWEKVPEEERQEYILNEYARLLEDRIRQNPEQWVWWHRRWRRRPGVDYEQYPEKLISTKNYVKWIESLATQGGK